MENDPAYPIWIDTRLAGALNRYHTWPTIGKQTVAEHTWNMLRIYFCLVEKVDPNIVAHIQFHDIGEIATGDIPYPIKRDNPKLKEQITFLEHKAHMAQMAHWNCFKHVFLTDADKILVKHIELMEMAEFGMDQVCLGNSYGYIIADRCLRAVYESEPCTRLIEYVILRLDLFFKQNRLGPLKGQWDQQDWWRFIRWEKMKDEQRGASDKRAGKDSG